MHADNSDNNDIEAAQVGVSPRAHNDNLTYLDRVMHNASQEELPDMKYGIAWSWEAHVEAAYQASQTNRHAILLTFRLYS